MPYDVFISYSSSDREQAASLNDRLRDAGFTVWFDRERLEPGFNWHEDIEAACENSRVVIPVLTPRWKESEWTRYETYGAESVLPLVSDGDWEDVRTPPLERFQAEKLEWDDASNLAWQRLIDALKKLLSQPVPQQMSRVTKLRYRPNPFFIGRESYLLRIHEELHCRPRAVLSHGRVRVIAALGGVGKTTLARHYVEKFWRCYRQIFWVDARGGLEPEYARIAEILFPDETASGLTEEQKAARALLELGSQETRLLILDNVEDEQSVQPWIPSSGGCHTLITSRFTKWSPPMPCIELPVLDSASSARFLRNRINHLSEGGESGPYEVLSEKLGCLPLALEQAAAYIDHQGSGFSISDYLSLYEKATRRLLASGSLGSTEYPDSVITTWTPTVQALSESARTILRLFAFMAATPLPIGVLVKSASSIQALANEDIDGENDELWIRDAVTSLKEYSMVRFEDQAISVHPLVQAVEQFDMGSQARTKWVELAIELLESSRPKNVDLPQAWDIWNDLHPHALAIRENATGADPRLRIALLDAIARYEFGNARFERSLRWEEEAFKVAERSFGTDSAELESRLINYGESLRALERYDEAEVLFQRAMDWQQEHGTEDLDKATCCNYLGLLYRVQDRHEEAERYLREGLEICERAEIRTGRTLVKLHLNLGFEIVKDASDEAERHFAEALEVAENDLGSDDILSFFAAGMLALSHNVGDRHEEAAPLFERAFRGLEEKLGETHPETLNFLGALATARHNTGDVEASEKLQRTLIERLARRPGPNHPRTGKAIRKLAKLLVDKADLEDVERRNALAEAEELYGRALHIHARDQWPNEWAAVQLSLGDVLRLQCADADDETTQAKLLDAASAYRRALEALKRDEGVIDWAASHQKLAHCLELLADRADGDERRQLLTEAAEAVQVAVTALGNAGEPDDAQFAIDLSNYARTLRELGRFDEASRCLGQAIEIEDQLLPPQHPKRAHRRNNLAVVKMLAGALHESSELSAEAWDLKSKVTEGGHDITSARILLVRVALSWLSSKDAGLYLGQLRTLLDQSGLGCNGNINRHWNAADILNHLESKLSLDQAQHLGELIRVLNEERTISELDRFTAWKDQRKIPLDAGWPS